MGLNINVLRDSMYRITGTDVDDADQTLVDICLNRAWWEIMAKFSFREKEMAVTFAILADEAVYDVPDPFDATKSISIVDANEQSFKLERITPEWYATMQNDADSSNGQPAYYFRENSTITLYPTPDLNYTGTFRYQTTLQDLSDSVGLPVPQEWHEIILFGGCWRLLLELGDFTRANELKATQIALIKSSIPVESKEEVDSRLSGVDFIGSKYEL